MDYPVPAGSGENLFTDLFDLAHPGPKDIRDLGFGSFQDLESLSAELLPVVVGALAWTEESPVASDFKPLTTSLAPPAVARLLPTALRTFLIGDSSLQPILIKDLLPKLIRSVLPANFASDDTLVKPSAGNAMMEKTLVLGAGWFEAAKVLHSERSGLRIVGHPGNEYPVFAMLWKDKAWELIVD